MGRTKRIAAAAFVGTLVVVGVATPAFAHDTRYDGPYACGVGYIQSCGYGQVRDSHQIVDSCDTRADGYGEVVIYNLRNGGSGQVRDPNGSASGCGIQRVGSASNPIVSYNVCSDQGILFCMGTTKTA